VSLPLALAAVAVGLVVLVRSADTFVGGAEAFALRRSWSPAVIGAVVVGFGTSLPELVTSLLAALRGQPDLALGNAAGSNVANLTLILGVAALVSPIVGERSQAPGRDAVIAGGAGVVLLATAWDGRVAAAEGALLLAFLVGSLGWQVRTAASGSSLHEPRELPLPVPERRAGLRIAGGLVGVLVSAQLLVAGATDLAERADVPEIVVGSVLVAVGTSLPELATAVASARRGQVEILLGNLFGSNAFNALAVVGGAAMVGAARGDGFPVDTGAFAVVAAAAVVTGGAAVLLARRPVVNRPVAGVLVALHLASVPALLAIS
jgi:cation:H+ antiporter